ncbi:Glucanosyltransferase-domain-containing protein [Pseudomassariella vexata]|uniref:1,3-beta-glucanosyltransferase n=1 Tax=Pseudomassariella vexata TaxID=1141098 RepID=A0A1Y2D8W1_9PEZI|nr:Glucanosyltransferase-domain-containing protein [Pseudomassariella vexata]ORY55075.1 Glucanosyltransferase-domain-containing protein [Pseudomassariella vexata]
MRFLASVLAAATFYGAATAIQTIEAVGNKFFTSDGKQWFMKGIAYQLVPDDPLVDTEQCMRDADLMKTLGANTIRVYHVDPDADHDGCMSAFAEAGIYTMIDMDTFATYIIPTAPAWNQTQFDAYKKVMDAFQGYDNLLGLFVGNEIISQSNHSLAAPFIKAAARDLKAYRSSMGYREIPVGYSAADIAELRPMLQNYLTCGGNASENIDFFGLNSYEWCDPSTYETSGYAVLEAQAKNFPVPIFFSETGCNTGEGGRTFEDQAAIFGPHMVDDWSGSMIYEWIAEANDYGLISYGPAVDPTATGENVVGGFTVKGTPTPVAPDFDNLKSQWATISPTGVSKSAYDAKKVSTRDCPQPTSGWLVNGNVALPSLGATLSSSGYEAVPSATGSAADASSTQNAVSGSNEIAGMAVGLVGVSMIFTFWL